MNGYTAATKRTIAAMAVTKIVTAARGLGTPRLTSLVIGGLRRGHRSGGQDPIIPRRSRSKGLTSLEGFGEVRRCVGQCRCRTMLRAVGAGALHQRNDPRDPLGPQ